MVKLDFPEYEFYVQEKGGAKEIFDAISQKYVVLTPEEWVRQHLVKYLGEEKQLPISLMQREIPVRFGRTHLRADLVAYDRTAKPLVVAECKAPNVRITQAAFDQVGRYNAQLQAPYVVVTNGLSHYYCQVDQGRGAVTFVDDLPMYDAIRAQEGERYGA